MKRFISDLFEVAMYSMDCVYHACVFLAIACYLAATAAWLAGNAAWLWEVTK